MAKKDDLQLLLLAAKKLQLGSGMLFQITSIIKGPAYLKAGFNMIATELYLGSNYVTHAATAYATSGRKTDLSKLTPPVVELKLGKKEIEKHKRDWGLVLEEIGRLREWLLQIHKMLLDIKVKNPPDEFVRYGTNAETNILNGIFFLQKMASDVSLRLNQ